MSYTSSHHCRRSRDHRVRRLKQEHLPELWRDTDVAFTFTVVTPLDSSNLTYHTFQPLLKRVGLPKIRFHDLRRTCATLLLGQNALRTGVLDNQHYVPPDYRARGLATWPELLNTSTCRIMAFIVRSESSTYHSGEFETMPPSQ